MSAYSGRSDDLKSWVVYTPEGLITGFESQEASTAAAKAWNQARSKAVEPEAEPEVERPVRVTRHAMIRAVQRKTDKNTEETIIEDVRAAFEAGRVATHKTEGFILYGARQSSLPPGQRFVWTEDKQMGYVVVREHTQDVVITSLTRVGVGGRKARQGVREKGLTENP